MVPSSESLASFIADHQVYGSYGVGWAWRTTHNWEAKSNTLWIELWNRRRYLVSPERSYLKYSLRTGTWIHIIRYFLRMYLNDIWMIYVECIYKHLHQSVLTDCFLTLPVPTPWEQHITNGPTGPTSAPEWLWIDMGRFLIPPKKYFAQSPV